MKVKEINVKEEYTKKFPKRNKKLLDFIFTHKLFPERLYIPDKALIMGGYLSFLFDYVTRACILQNRGELLLEKFIELCCGGDVIIKNQDQIFEEKGELIIIDCESHSNFQADNLLLRLYPNKKPYYLAFDAIRISGKPFYFLLQAGFLAPEKIKIVDNLPKIDNIVLKGEKIILYPLFEKIVNKMFFKLCYFYLN